MVDTKKWIFSSIAFIMILLTLQGVFAISDGFEDGDFTTAPVWTQSGSGFFVSSPSDVEGSYFLNFTGGGTNVYEKLISEDNSTALYTGAVLSGWIRKSSGLADAFVKFKFDSVYLNVVYNENNHVDMGLLLDCNGAGYDTATKVLTSTGSWYRFELTYMGSDLWNYSVYNITGDLVGNYTGFSCAVGSSFTRTEIWDYDYSGEPEILAFDNVTYSIYQVPEVPVSPYVLTSNDGVSAAGYSIALDSYKGAQGILIDGAYAQYSVSNVTVFLYENSGDNAVPVVVSCGFFVLNGSGHPLDAQYGDNCTASVVPNDLSASDIAPSAVLLDCAGSLPILENNTAYGLVCGIDAVDVGWSYSTGDVYAGGSLVDYGSTEASVWTVDADKDFLFTVEGEGVTLATGLSSFWHFTTRMDNSGRTHNLSANPGGSASPLLNNSGIYGTSSLGGYNFDNNILWNTTWKPASGESFAISFWEYYESGASPGLISMGSNTASYSSGFGSFVIPDSPVISYMQSGNVNFWQQQFSANAWHNHIFSYDAVNGVIKTWIDGTLIDTQSGVVYDEFPCYLAIHSKSCGSEWGTPADVRNYIDEMGVWTRDFVQADADATWNGGAGNFTFFPEQLEILSAYVVPSSPLENDTMQFFCNASSPNGQVSYIYSVNYNGVLNVSGESGLFDSGVAANVLNISNPSVGVWNFTCQANASGDVSGLLVSADYTVSSPPPPPSTSFLIMSYQSGGAGFGAGTYTPEYVAQTFTANATANLNTITLELYKYPGSVGDFEVLLYDVVGGLPNQAVAHFGNYSYDIVSTYASCGPDLCKLNFTNSTGYALENGEMYAIVLHSITASSLFNKLILMGQDSGAYAGGQMLFTYSPWGNDTYNADATFYLYQDTPGASLNLTMNSAYITPTEPSSADNMQFFCNASDTNGGQLVYNYVVTHDGVGYVNGTSELFDQGIDANVLNITNPAVGSWYFTCQANSSTEGFTLPLQSAEYVVNNATPTMMLTQFTVVNPSGGALNGQQIALNITYNASMQRGFEDLRFYDANNVSLSYWLQSDLSLRSYYALVWVEMNMSAGNNTLQMTFGNSSLASASDGYATWWFFEDWSSSFNLSIWDNPDHDWDGPGHAECTNLTVANGELVIGDNLGIWCTIGTKNSVLQIPGAAGIRLIQRTNLGTYPTAGGSNGLGMGALGTDYFTRSILFSNPTSPEFRQFKGDFFLPGDKVDVYIDAEQRAMYTSPTVTHNYAGFLLGSMNDLGIDNADVTHKVISYHFNGVVKNDFVAAGPVTFPGSDPYSVEGVTVAGDVTPPVPVACSPDWSCNGYATCPVGLGVCTSVQDLNTCGENYTGNYSEFTSLNCSVSLSVSCDPIVYPNELDLPSAAKIGFNVTVTSAYNLSSPSFAASLGGVVTACSAQSGHYNCSQTKHYYDAAGLFSVAANLTDGLVSATVSAPNVCEYGSLLASQRVVSSISFPTAAPGVVNAQSNVPMVVKNTGNVPLNVAVTGYDLTGRDTPSVKLLASAFKAGATLGAANTMSNGVSVNITSVASAQNANATFWFWLTMPQSQLVQGYYSATPWSVGATG